MQKTTYITISLIFLSFLFFGTTNAQSNSRVNELRQQIEERNRAIDALEGEIDAYRDDLFEIGKEKQTLQNELREIEISQKKLEADISVIQQKINNSDSIIEELSLKIQEQERKTLLNKESLGRTLRSIDELDDQSFIESLLSEGGATEAWSNLDTIASFQINLSDRLSELEVLKKEIEINKEEQLKTRSDLVGLREEIVDKRSLVEQTRREQSQLVAATENKESEYQSLISEKQTQKQQFEQELLEIESALQIAIDPSRIPPMRNGLFSWPLDNIFVTQYFGKTSDSGRLYASGTHNGVDFRASRGSNIRTVLSGTVQATGDTSLPNTSCLSYGKWILINHNNGISTLYAHLSQVRVQEGQNVSTGQLIGYSGNTGYSTGPHLHLTAYATEGVRVDRLGSFNGEKVTACRDAILPVADSKAYMDPLSYLPVL